MVFTIDKCQRCLAVAFDGAQTAALEFSHIACICAEILYNFYITSMWRDLPGEVILLFLPNPFYSSYTLLLIPRTHLVDEVAGIFNFPVLYSFAKALWDSY
jgi:hypothetical protein